MGGYRTKVTAATPQLLPTGQIGSFVAAALERGDSVQYVPAQISLPFTDIVTVTTLALPVGLEGFAYTAALAALGGTLPYTWGATGLPSWATLSGNTISGTPNSTAPSTLTVTATDADGRVSLPVVLSLQVSGVGIGAFAYAGGSDQRAYVVPGPQVVVAIATPSVSNPPQAVWEGYQDTTSLAMMAWPPSSQTSWVPTDGSAPAYYKVYRNGTLVCGNTTNTTGLTNPGVTADPVVPNGQGAPSTRPMPWYVDRGLASGVSYNYQFSAVRGGVESALSSGTVMTTLTNITSVLPTPPVDPGTWIQDGTGAVNLTTFQLPAATRTIVTQTSLANYNAAGGLGWALSTANPNFNINGPNIIVLPAGVANAIQVPASGVVMPAFTGTGGWTYIISSQEPVLTSGGTLIPYAYTPVNLALQVLSVSGSTIAAGATSATLVSQWTQKTGLYYVYFREGTAPNLVNEERLALLTNGSTTVDWSNTNAQFPNLNALYQSAGLAAVVNPPAGYSTPVIQVAYLPSVTPADVASMATLNWGSSANSTCILMPTGTGGSGACNKVRFVGINFQPTQGAAHSSLTIVSFANVNYANSANPPTKCEHIYFDRCLRGNDTNQPGWTSISHGLNAVNCDYLLNAQTYDWGIVNDFNVNSGDSNHYLLGGGYHCWQNFYVQCGGEGIIYGGAYVSPPPDVPHDVVVRYGMSHKPLSWLGGYASVTGIIAAGASSATLTAPWNYASGTYLTTFKHTGAGAEQYPVTYLLGSTAISWSTPLTAASDTYLVLYQSNGTHFLATPWGLFGQTVKNHLELKACNRAEYYGLLICNGWLGTIQSYHSAAFAVGARDQQWAATQATNLDQCCPWAQVTDIYNHDNQCFNCTLFYCFTGDASPSAYTARVKFYNDLCFLNPLNQGTAESERVRGIQIQGPCSDLIIDHCTLIVNQSASTASVGLPYGVAWVQGGTGAGSYQVPVPYSPGAWSQYQDRFTLINNIVDSGVGANLAFNIGSASLPDPFTAGAYPSNLTLSKNLTISDSTAYGSGTITDVGYAGVGFNNMPSTGSTVMPLFPSDWSLAPTSAYYASGTDGLPLGANVAQSLQFPLVGGVYIAGSVQTSFGTSAFQDAIANNNDVAVIGTYPGWTGGGFTMASAAAAIKAINPTIKLVPYTNIMELEAGVGPSGSAYSPIFNAATTMNWFLRTAWPSGSITDADGNAQDGLNQTTFTVAGTGSYAGYANYLAWRAAWTAANEYPGSNWDGVYLDNVFSIPRVSADYNQSGSSQTASAAKTNWQNGYVAYAAPGGYLRTALPAGKLVFGNSADWANTSVTAYNGMLDGPVIEGVTTYQTTWATQIAAYKASMLHTRTPSYAIYCQDGVVTNYQFFRYGFTMCLLDNAYYYHSNNGTYDTVEVYDEYSFNLGAPIAGPNNASNGTLSNGGLTVWKSQGPSGVWRRDFVNGIAICNPAGNGSQSVVVDVSVNYWHLRGTQANPPNSATEVTAGSSVTLADGDGLILSRTAT